MVARTEIFWADLGAGLGRRPLCVVTRDAAIPFLQSVTAAPLSRTLRGIASEVQVGETEGLSARSAISCDNLVTFPKALLDPEPVGSLDELARAELDGALRYALDIRY